jgi:hypothetical protein
MYQEKQSSRPNNGGNRSTIRRTLMLVKTRLVIDSFEKQFGLFLRPFLESLSRSLALQRTLADQVGAFESPMIAATLHACDDNVTATCLQLGMPITTLYDKLKKYRRSLPPGCHAPATMLAPKSPHTCHPAPVMPATKYNRACPYTAPPRRCSYPGRACCLYCYS